MKILRTLIIGCILFFSFIGNVFANNSTSKEEKTELQKTINSYILEVYKFQGNKILQDLDTNLEKVAPTKEAKVEAYKNIQETLKLKKASIEKDAKIGKNSKSILTKYLDYMLKELETKKSQLK